MERSGNGGEPQNQFDRIGWWTNWPSVRAFKPQQIGKDSRWQEIFSAWGSFARKTNGSAYQVIFEYRTNAVEFWRTTNLDQIVPQTYSTGEERSAYVGKDGTLWIRNWRISEYDGHGMPDEGPGYLQVGSETNWVTTAMDQHRLIVLKADGSLWHVAARPPKSAVEALKVHPTRFGIHDDWVGLTSSLGGSHFARLRMAACGSGRILIMMARC